MNTYFQFRQFTIHQDKCSMKVCTDSCLFGAWTANRIQQTDDIDNIIDIGCGTGLLSLMLAQNIAANFDAIEIDSDAASQAKENVDASPWKKKIRVMNISLQQFITEKKYDLIISNPPFFENDLRSKDKNKNVSKHDTTLMLHELLFFITNHLSEKGKASLLIPFHRSAHFSSLIKDCDLFINETLFVKQSPSHAYFRSLFLLSRKETQPIESSELTIHNEERSYTDAFKMLLKPYYLKL